MGCEDLYEKLYQLSLPAPAVVGRKGQGKEERLWRIQGMAVIQGGRGWLFAGVHTGVPGSGQKRFVLQSIMLQKTHILYVHCSPGSNEICYISVTMHQHTLKSDNPTLLVLNKPRPRQLGHRLQIRTLRFWARDPWIAQSTALRVE